MAYDLLVEFFIYIEDVCDFEGVLVVKFDIIDELFPYILIVENVLKESHHFMKPPHMRCGLTLTINNPPPCNNPTTLSLYLTLFNKVDSLKYTIFEESLFSHTLADKYFHMIDVDM